MILRGGGNNMRSRLKQERLKRGWTQAYVAQKIGVQDRFYRHIEAETRNPSYETVKKLRTLFNIPDEELLVPDSITSNIRQQQEGGESYERQTQ